MCPARAAFVVLLFGSACVSDETSVIPGPDASADESADVTRAFAPPPGDDVCDHLPDDGPCALACDVDALTDEYVPVGTCAAFHCVLDDGREVSVHACHPQS